MNSEVIGHIKELINNLDNCHPKNFLSAYHYVDGFMNAALSFGAITFEEMVPLYNELKYKLDGEQD